MKAIFGGLVLAALAAAPAAAEFMPVRDGKTFSGLVAGRELTRFGVRLTLTPKGDITGRAFGRQVTGAWAWKDGYFCREMAWGSTEFAYNCQTVAREGAALRFTADKGQGDVADLTLK